MKMKRILFGVYGFGLGHATRIHAIIERLKDFEIKIVASGDAYDYFRKLRMNPIPLKSFVYGTTSFSFSWFWTFIENINFPINMIMDYYKLSEIVKRFKPDIIFSDSEPASFMFSVNRKIPNAFLTNLISVVQEKENLPKEIITPQIKAQISVIENMLDIVLKSSDRIFFPTFEKYRLQRKVKQTDVIVRKTIDELEDEEKIRKKLKIYDDFYLVTFGGSLVGIELLDVLMKIFPKFSNKKFIISSRKYKKTIVKKNMIIMPFIRNYLEYLKICRGVICLSGHSTLSEIIAYKKPCLTIPILGQVEQITNANTIMRNKFGSAIFFEEGKINEKKVYTKLRSFFRDEQKFRRNLRKCKLKGKGAQEIADFLSNL